MEFQYEKRKYYRRSDLRSFSCLCDRYLSWLSESRSLRYRRSGSGTLAGHHRSTSSDLFRRPYRRYPDDEKDQFPELPMWTPGTKRVYISMAILLVYMLVLSTLGFIIPSVIMLFAFCQWFHKGAFWKNALISVIVVLDRTS